MIKVIAIKPPQGTLSLDKYRKALTEGTRRATEEASKLLVAPTRGWQEKNKPNPIKSYGPNSGSVTIGKKVYIYQDRGTRPHVIVPRKKKVLRFPVQGQIVFTKHVDHPGTEPRNFSIATAHVMSLIYQKLLNEEIAKAVHSTGD